jgi:hypothetical protein
MRSHTRHKSRDTQQSIYNGMGCENLANILRKLREMGQRPAKSTILVNPTERPGGLKGEVSEGGIFDRGSTR